MSIGAKLLGSILGVLLVCTAASTYRTTTLTESALEAAIAGQQSAAAAGAARELEARLDGLTQLLAETVRAAHMRALLADPRDPERLRVTNARLNGLRNSHPVVDVAGLIGADGLLKAGTAAANIGKQNLSDRDYFREAMQGRTVISRPSKSRATGKPAFFIAMPVMEGNKALGVVYMTLDLIKLGDISLKGMHSGQRGYAFLSAPPGLTLYHPESARIFENTSGFAWMRDMFRHREGTFRYAFNGVERMAGLATVPSTGWLVALTADRDDVLSSVIRIRNAGLLASAIMLLVVAAVVVLAVRGITRALRAAVTVAEGVAAGDLDQQAPTDRRDELGTLGRALDAMIRNLRAMRAASEEKTREAQAAAEQAGHARREAEEARAAAENARREGQLEAAARLERMTGEMHRAAEELSAQVRQAAHGADTQRGRVTETATAIEEMNSTVLEVAQNASKAAQASEEAQAEAVRGADVVRQVAEAIGGVNRHAHDMAGMLQTLGGQAEGIGRVLNVISDIADQTNLLALNAAIEAARAGDAGRGFAVVADEVRKLAEKTMAATREVAEAVTSIQGGVGNTIKAMDAAGGAVQRSDALAEEAGAALQAIVRIVESSADQVRAIAAASEEQSSTTEQISRSAEEINRIAGETSDAMQRSGGAVEDLSNLARQLQGLVDELKQE